MTSYELAFHINPNMEETRIQSIRADLEQTITSQGGAVSFTKEPERINLSYPIAKNNSAYFGYIQFNSDKSELLAALDEHIKLNNDILRAITLKLPPESKRSQTARYIRSRDKIEKKPAPKAPTEAEEKKLEQEVEEILEKL